MDKFQDMLEQIVANTKKQRDSAEDHLTKQVIGKVLNTYEIILYTYKSHKSECGSKERIICAANYYDDGKIRDNSPNNINSGFVICGRRHHNCISMFAQMYGFPYSEEVMKINKTEVQGFLTNTNRFVDRYEALKIASVAGQIITGDGNSALGLFSEDLY